MSKSKGLGKSKVTLQACQGFQEWPDLLEALCVGRLSGGIFDVAVGDLVHSPLQRRGCSRELCPSTSEMEAPQ